jgi:hypothetical protein
VLAGLIFGARPEHIIGYIIYIFVILLEDISLKWIKLSPFVSK